MSRFNEILIKFHGWIIQNVLRGLRQFFYKILELVCIHFMGFNQTMFCCVLNSFKHSSFVTFGFSLTFALSTCDFIMINCIRIIFLFRVHGLLNDRKTEKNSHQLFMLTLFPFNLNVHCQIKQNLDFKKITTIM